MNSESHDILEMPYRMVTKRLSMDSERWAWVERESSRLGLSHHAFISTLMEWAEDAEIAQENELGVFDYREVA